MWFFKKQQQKQSEERIVRLEKQMIEQTARLDKLIAALASRFTALSEQQKQARGESGVAEEQKFREELMRERYNRLVGQQQQNRDSNRLSPANTWATQQPDYHEQLDSLSSKHQQAALDKIQPEYRDADADQAPPPQAEIPLALDNPNRPIRYLLDRGAWHYGQVLSRYKLVPSQELWRRKDPQQ